MAEHVGVGRYYRITIGMTLFSFKKLVRLVSKKQWNENTPGETFQDAVHATSYCNHSPL